MSTNDFAVLKKLCCSNHFVCRGKAFFRVHGDGVFQVVKCEKVRHFPAYEIAIGLFSMYGELRADWFTSPGCIPRYAVVEFEGKRSAVYSEKNGEVYYGRTISLEHQISILESSVMSFLDEITSQAHLAEAICDLDKMTYASIIWNDMLKYAPFVASGNYASARKVIQAILDQHSFALERNRTFMSPQDFQADCLRTQAEDYLLIQKLNMVEAGDQAVINEFLHANYVQNCKYARFAMFNKQRTGDNS